MVGLFNLLGFAALLAGGAAGLLAAGLWAERAALLAVQVGTVAIGLLVAGLALQAAAKGLHLLERIADAADRMAGERAAGERGTGERMAGERRAA
jgi:NhaP-type Na+/H+ or K+/H+ antiporter